MKAAAFTALVLAGSRPAGDPLAKTFGVSHKALLPIAGKPMLAWVVDALRGAVSIDRVAICGLDRSTALAHPDLAPLLESATFMDAGATPGASVALAIEAVEGCIPLLVTTGDHPLLTPSIVDDFCVRAMTTGADVALAFVDGEGVRAAFPGAERTYLALRGGTYHGANLYAFLTPESQRAAQLWTQVEKDRKRPWRMVRVLGAGTLLRFAARRLSLDDIVGLVAEKMDLSIAPILLDEPEAGFDVDRASHIAEVERVLRGRDGG